VTCGDITCAHMTSVVTCADKFFRYNFADVTCGNINCVDVTCADITCFDVTCADINCAYVTLWIYNLCNCD